MNRMSVERRRFLRGVPGGDGASRPRDRSNGNRHGRAPQRCLWGRGTTDRIGLRRVQLTNPRSLPSARRVGRIPP